MLSMLAKLLKALNSESAPGQVALAFALALIVGLTPLFSLHNLFVLFLACVIRVNFSAFILGVLFFSGVAWFVDPLSIRMGASLLANPALISTWTELYQSELWRISGYNNTLVLGGLVFALIAFVPVLLISRILIIQYRHRVMAWINKLKITQMLKASKFYNLYQNFGG